MDTETGQDYSRLFVFTVGYRLTPPPPTPTPPPPQPRKSLQSVKPAKIWGMGGGAVWNKAVKGSNRRWNEQSAWAVTTGADHAQFPLQPSAGHASFRRHGPAPSACLTPPQGAPAPRDSTPTLFLLPPSRRHASRKPVGSRSSRENLPARSVRRV